MDFDLNDDQRLLKDSVDRLIADRYGFEQRRGYMAEDGGWSRAVWAQFAELGTLGEQHGYVPTHSEQRHRRPCAQHCRGS